MSAGQDLLVGKPARILVETLILAALALGLNELNPAGLLDRRAV